MKLKGLIAMMALAMIACANTSANGIVNPSFEHDGDIVDINATPPMGWDVNVPAVFTGSVNAEWATDGSYSLELSTIASGVFETVYYLTDDTVAFSQEINLKDVNSIKFDLRLYQEQFGTLYDEWSLNFDAFVKIDGNDVWTPGVHQEGELLNQSINVSNYDSNSIVTFGFVSLTSADYFAVRHITAWDNIRYSNEVVVDPPVVEPGYEPNNTSFEFDGYIQNIRTSEPNSWDVNLSAEMFGEISSNWVTDGEYSLMFYAEGYRQYYLGEMATVSQDINMTDIQGLFFDYRLYARQGIYEKQWDSNDCKAVIYLGEQKVWDSSASGFGSYLSEQLDLSTVSGTHRFTIGVEYMRDTNINQDYASFFDFLRFYGEGPCYGNGYIGTDLNFDCYVDFDDFVVLVDYWLIDDFAGLPAYSQLADIDEDEVVDFADYVRLLDDFGMTTDISDHNSVDGVYWPLEMDINYDVNMTDGTVDFVDFAIYAKTADINDANSLKMVTDQWLQVAPPNKK